MAKVKTAEDIIILRVGGKRLARVLGEVSAQVKPGVTGRELDALARKLIVADGDQPSFLNYRAEGAATPFTAALCISINNEIVHGTPSDRSFKTGDIVSLDLGLNHRGLFTDMSVTVPVGQTSTEAHKLIEATRTALASGIARARAGNTLGDIGFAISAVAKKNNYGVVRELGGHGVGHRVHEAPHIPNFGKQGKGGKLKPGMVLAIEPMFTLGSAEVIFKPDGYLVTTADGSLAAHFEHTILITDAEPEILTEV